MRLFCYHAASIFSEARMIGAMREKMQGIFAIVIIGFICVVFALWGVESLFSRSGNVKAPLTINGTDISEQQINQAVSMARERYSEIFKGKIDSSFLTDKMLREPAIESLINRTLLSQQLIKMKLVAAPGSIDREIVRTPEFSKDGQRFDPDTFKEKLRNAGMTPAIYRARLNDALAMEQLQRGITDTAFVTEKQIDAAVSLVGQSRNFEFVRLSEKEVADKIQPDKKAVEQYFKDHANEFMTEETVVLEYLDLNKEELSHQAEVSEDEIKEAYDKEAAAFKPSVERHAAHIMIEEKADGSQQVTLNEVEAKLKEGGDFSALAKKYSDDKESAVMGGDVGFSAGDVFEPEFEKALAALAQVGDVSQPIKTRYGYHIIKLLGKKDTTFPSWDERKSALKEQLAHDKADAVYSEKISQVTDSTYSAGDLAGPAVELKMEVKKTEPFGRRGGKGLAAQQKVIDAAFSEDLLDSGRNSQVIELSAGRSVVIRVASHQMPKPKALESVKADIIAALKAEQAASQLKAQVDTIQQKMQSGKSLSDIADAEKLTRKVLENQKANTASGADAELVAQAFTLNTNPADAAATQSFQLNDGDWVVMHLLAVNHVKADKTNSEYASVQTGMNGRVGSDDFSLYQQALRQVAKIERRETSTENSEGNPEGDAL